MTINCKGKLLDLTMPVVAGILNLTPDSFYDGGKYADGYDLIERVKEIINEGAEILDIGAYSSRPGAKHINEKEELQRLTSALDLIRKDFPDLIISVDTFRSNVADHVIKEYRVDIINDISGGNYDPEMFETIAEHQVPYIVMHMKGMPQNMQNDPVYDNILKELLKYFSEKKQKAAMIGINDLIIDPGFGFGKTIDQNYILLKNTELFKMLELPIMAGLSRKSMIYKLDNSNPQKALSGTIALNMIALNKGANILRVHDVKEAVQTIEVFKKYHSV